MEALRRAACGLTAGLMMASSALAQYSARFAGQERPVISKTVPIVPAQPVAADTMPAQPVLDSRTKLEEIKVQLALLSEPATFGRHLSARADGNAIAVKGYVPKEAVRQK